MSIDQKIDFNHNELIFAENDESFTTKEAITEAKRCLNCPKPLCRTGCPIENEIPQFIMALAKGNLGEASNIIAERSNLPAVCSRVCPHEKQCEAACVMTKKGNGIKIGKIERFIADFDSEMEINAFTPKALTKGKIAVIGSGPAGLTVAGDLAKMGFAVTVFEAQPQPGGVLLYGIPEFRLNKEVVRREIKKIERLGIEFKTNIMIGIDITIDDLFSQGYDAMFIGTGTAMPRTLELPGVNLPGIMQATYFLSMVVLINTNKLDHRENPVHAGDKVVVIGSGNVAIDAARTALRLGASKVTVVYRKTLNEMTALKSEYEHAKNEGVEYRWLASPLKFIGTNNFIGTNEVTAIEVELQEIDSQGKFNKTGQTEIIPADKIIVAVGQRPAARIVSTTEGIKVTPQGYVITKDHPYGMTTKRGVFAGGDVVHEPATVVLAMKEAKKVATGIALYVEAKKLLDEC